MICSNLHRSLIDGLTMRVALADISNAVVGGWRGRAVSKLFIKLPSKFRKRLSAFWKHVNLESIYCHYIFVYVLYEYGLDSLMGDK